MPVSPKDPRAAYRRRREALGLTQNQLAQLLGVDPSTLFRWESGDSQKRPMKESNLKLWHAILTMVERERGRKRSHRRKIA